MSTTALASVAETRPSTATHPAIRARNLAAAILSVASLALAIVFGVAFGGFGLFSLVVGLSLPLLLIWAAADVVRTDEVRS